MEKGESFEDFKARREKFKEKREEMQREIRFEAQERTIEHNFGKSNYTNGDLRNISDAIEKHRAESQAAN